MAAISRKTIRGTIRLRGDYTNTRRFSNDYLNTEIQTSFGHFWRIVDSARQGWWDTEGTVTTIVGQAFIAPPADAKVVKGVDRLDGGNFIEMPQVGIDARNRWGSGNGKPLAYWLSSRGIELGRGADAAYTLRVLHTPKPPILTENEEREWYDGWEDYVIEKTLFELDSREGKPMGDRQMKLDRAEKALRDGAGERRQQEPEYLRLREYDNLDPFDDGILG